MSEIIPLSNFTELNDTVVESQLYWDYKMPPYLDVEKVGVNLDRLHKIHQLGGIGCSIVRGYQGDRTEYTPGISGINANGTAVASRAGVLKQADESKSTFFEINELLKPPYNKILAGHGINKPALADTVSDKVGKGKDREAAYISELDKIFRQSLLKISKQNLIGRPQPFTRAVYSTILASSTFLIGTDHTTVTSSGYAALYAGIVGIESWSNNTFFGETLLKERRWSLSLYSEFQPDRYLVASAVCRIPGLITTVK